MATRILLRRGAAAQWTEADPVLAAGEPAVETDTGQIKVGDGLTAWSALPYILDEADLAAKVSDGTGPLSAALREASVQALEEATDVAPAGTWDFAQPPTVAGAPIAAGGSDFGDLRAFGIFRPENYGAVGDGVTDDTAALNACTFAARMVASKRGGKVLLGFAKRYAVSAPINLYTAVSIEGSGWSMDTTNYNVSALIALPGFVGSAILKLNNDGVIHPTELRPDMSWHWGRLEKFVVKGLGVSGPHGIDPGWNGEASSIENVQLIACNSGIYLNDTQASATLNNVSAFDCNIGVNCDAITGSVRIYGLSGDNNTSLLRVKGGRAANVSVFGLKAESYNAGTGDPVVDIVDLDGGRVLIAGGWAETNAARTRVVRISATTAVNKPRVTLIGLDANDLYTNLLEDTIASQSVGVTVDAVRAPLVQWNGPLLVGGQGNMILANGSLLKTTATSGALTESGVGNSKVVNFQSGTTYTFSLGDAWRQVDFSNAAAITATIPPNSSVPFPVGAVLTLVQFGTGQVTASPGAGVTVSTPAGKAAKSQGQWSTIYARKRDTDHWVLFGDLADALRQTTQTGAAYTFALGDAGSLVEGNSASAQTFTVPPNSSVPFPVGTRIWVRQYGAGQLTVAAGAGVTLRSRGGRLRAAGQYAEIRLTKRATDEWVVSEDVIV